MIIDHAHYWAQFAWVIGNLVWATGEIFLKHTDRDEAHKLWERFFSSF
jgi:hypothetical protein